MTTPVPDPAPLAYYEILGPGRFRSTAHAQGAWGHEQQHMAPISGLLTRAIEECSPRDDLMISRIAFDILGVITMGPVEIEARVIRPGRTIELVEAEMSVSGRVVVRATAWRLARSDTAAISGSPVDSMPGPDEGENWQGSAIWDGGFIRTLQFRVLPGWRPGRGQVWIRSDVDLVADGNSSPLARYLRLVDTANGIAVRADPATLLFPNTDLTVHLVRHPVGQWVGLDTTVSFGSDGIGLTASVLHDISGPIGRAAQTLTLRPVSELRDVRAPDAVPFAT
ncbi:MAG: thioesterase family protein [Nakamurella sp.]